MEIILYRIAGNMIIISCLVFCFVVNVAFGLNTTVTTQCEKLTTDTEYRFRYNPSTIDVKMIEFEVQASNDVHIALTSAPEDASEMYEIVIGGWGNSRSVIRRCKQCHNQVTVSTRRYLSANELRGFWIGYDNTTGLIKVGKKGEAYFMQWQDPNPLDVKYLGYSTGWGSTGVFTFCNLTQSSTANATVAPRQGLLVWTELNVRTKRARINSLPADPASYISSPSIATTGFYESTPAHWISITNDYDDRLVFWTDAARKRIMQGGLGNGATASPVFTGTSQTVDGIAVDWLANNIYWADGAYDWIILANYNVSQYRVLIDAEMDKPRGITVFPQRGYLFWSDWGDSQKVERSNLAGENRTLIADTGLYYPNGLAIDYYTDKLYWVDADPSGSRIEVCDLDGNGRRTVFSVDQGQGHLFDLTIFGDYIFVSDWHEQMRCIRKTQEEQYFALNVGARPFGVTVYGPDNLPGTTSPCDSSPCEHLCVSDSDGYKCVCSDNFRLLDDGHTCERAIDGLAAPQILMASKNSLCNFPGNFPDMIIAPDQAVNCFLTNRSFAVGLEVDIPARILFYSDFEKKTIERVRLLQGESVDTIRAGIGSVEGLAVDWLSQNIYWTDALYHHIAVSRYDGQHRKVLVGKNIIKPRSIAIHAELRVMFWTEFGPPGHIEKAGLDGKGREIIVSGLTSPNGLAIDFKENRLYFSDRQSGSLEHVDFDGGNKRNVYTRVGAQYFDMDIFKDYIIWTEWNNYNGIHAMNRENGRVTQSLRISTAVYGVKVFAAERQPNGTSVCGVDNGNCEHLCLPSKGRGYSCDCGTGYVLADDERSCVTNVATDDFMLATDSYLHGIVQIFIDNSRVSYTALDLGPMTNPISVDYDPVEGRVYWSDVKEQNINRAFLNGTGREVIAGPEDGIRIPDGIAIDRSSRLIYWTDAEKNTTSVSKLDGSRRRTLISENVDQPRAIALDIENGYMYWSDWGDTARIERAFMNGTNRQTIVDTDLGWPNGIALDLAENMIYWCDAKTNKIERSTLTGENRTVMVDLGDEGSENMHAFGIAIHGPYIFWTDWRKRSLMKANKADGSNNGTIGPDDFIRLNSIKIYRAVEDNATTDCAPDNGGCSSLCLPTPYGAVCACEDGDSLGPDGKTCWLDLKCPMVIPHGNISNDCSDSLDGTCSVICDEGYTLGAISIQVRCLDSGEWDIDTSSLCQAVECDPLPLPFDANALPCPSPYLYGATCSHRCDTGWERQGGNKDRTCQADGTWSGTDLVCRMVTCDPLVPPEYGSYSNKNCSTVGGHYNDLCIAQCQEGFQLLGVTERGCLATGEWTDADANSTCIDVTIPIFFSTCKDITVTAPRGKLQANVSYSRPNATDNSGKPIKIWSRRDEYLDPPALMDEGVYIMTFYAQDWVHNTAGCTFVITVNVIRCPVLATPINGYYDNCQNHYGASCAVTCNEGFRRQGDEVRTCEIDSSSNPYWTGQAPSCQQIVCTEATVGPHTLKAGCRPPYIYGTECVYLCQPGYVRVRGSNRRQCQADSQWDGTPLLCEIQHCSPVTTFDHGIISPPSCTATGGEFDDVCTVSCKEGFRLVGAVEQRCLATGKWSNNLEDSHFCIDITAPHFNNTCPNDLTVYAKKGEVDAVATWSLHATDNNKDDIVNVTSSKKSGTRFVEGDHLVLVRAEDSTGNNGTCEFTISVQVVRCPELPVLPFSANPALCDTHYGAQCSFACMEGYMLVGNDNITCDRGQNATSIGRWSGDQPECQAAMCPRIQTTKNITVGCRNTEAMLPYGINCPVSCAPGYNGSEPTNWVCQTNGEWSGNDILCELQPCEPAEISNTVTVSPPGCLDNGHYGDSCKFSCPVEGYEMSGPDVHNCTASGRWTTYYEMTVCTDNTPPVFDGPCPRVTTLTVEPCLNSTLVNVTKPSATDNSGYVEVLGQVSQQRELSVGEHLISYIAMDGSFNLASCDVTIVVRMIQCPAPIPDVDINNLASLSCSYQYGTVATFRCPPGQRPSSSSPPLTCNIDGEWMGTSPECEEITCDPLQAPPNGSLTPSKCTQSQMPLGSKCLVDCDRGYAYRVTKALTCLESGNWSMDVATIKCYDIETPVFQTCPSGIDVALPIGSNQTTFNWEIPTATDNSGDIPVVKNAERNIAPPLTMGPGYRIIQYVAADSSGNLEYCIFTVTVHDTEPPTVKLCPSPKVYQVNSLPVTATWMEPMFTDNVAVTKVTSNERPGIKVYSWGRHTVTYTARDAGRNQAQCVVFIDVVDSTNCLPLTAPANGALACENDRLCTVHCNNGYVFTDKYKPQSAYSCMENGFWDYGDNMERSPNLPACSKVSPNDPVNWERKDKVKFELHHLDGNCEDVQQQIQERFQQLLRSSAFMDYCRRDPTNNCKVDNVEVQCGDTDKIKRRKRQADEQQPDDILSLIYDLFGQRENSEEIDALLTAMNMSISDVFGGDNVTLTIDGQPVSLSTQDGQAGQIQANCDSNQTLADNGLSCVNCPVGTRYNPVSGECIRCPSGSYQDESAQRSCKNCPQYMSTASQGATDRSLCIDICQPGEYSPSGLVPCQKCPRGSHQQSRGKKGCTPCPEGMSTKKTGATTSFLCISQDQVGPLISTALPVPTQSPQSTRIHTTSTGKIDMSSTSSSVVITKVFSPDKGPDTLTSQATPQAYPNKSVGSPFSLALIIGLVVGVLVVIVLIAICIGVIMSKTRRKVPRGARPLSWNGSEAGIMNQVDDDDDDDYDTHRAGYQQLEEHPDYVETRVDGDRRYHAANAIANPAYEPTFSTFKDDSRKSSCQDQDDSFADSFHIFAPSDGPLDSVELN